MRPKLQIGTRTTSIIATMALIYFLCQSSINRQYYEHVVFQADSREYATLIICCYGNAFGLVVAISAIGLILLKHVHSQDFEGATRKPDHPSGWNVHRDGRHLGALVFTARIDGMSWLFTCDSPALLDEMKAVAMDSKAQEALVYHSRQGRLTVSGVNFGISVVDGLVAVRDLRSQASD